MNRFNLKTGAAAIALAIGFAGAAAPAPALAQSMSAKPSETLNLSQGTGTLVRLSSPMTDVFVANDKVADVQVRSSTQLYVFGKGNGETTVYATGKDGRVVYASTVRVGNNISSVDEMLRLAMPEANLQATPMNNLVLLTGTVASPTDVEEAQRLVQAYVGEGTQVVSRLRSSTPLQVNLRVRIAEVNRSLLKQFGVNLLGVGNGFSVAQGDGIYVPPAGAGDDTDGSDTGKIIRGTIGTTFGLGKRFLGLDLIGRLNLAETDGLVTTLAEPNLTALSGETASFLAGGEFPIPVSQGNQGITIEYKQYGVGLAFTPIVLGDGRISMRVRPEVSELSNEGSVKLNDFVVPALTTRRAETTVELGSGQSFMIAGLLRNALTNDIDKAPFLGDLPILGALFRSTSYKRQETELVIIVTPYLVRPVSGRMALPTDGLRAPTDAQRVAFGQTVTGVSAAPAAAPVATIQAVPGSAAAPGFKL
ncbi:type II and III secretion system protein family protein [Sphingomonas sinipercae]|uniref:Type II and III secretion system protein family protein n=1 Tax=Sphingomonas sinipercae TaxID=2714944 RepID=A0A6G7ZPE0_9SPHN|nr:type II and III secretion system protein family protein [Sphingomonas sinipercae]QIL02789.1 type II and III secretion system protein family protein [Sphingomonas sinipercae]